MNTNTESLARVWFVGIGPGEAGLLTIGAARLIAEADAVVGDIHRHGPVVAEHLGAATWIHVSAQDKSDDLTSSRPAKQLVLAARTHPKVVRLVDGDGSNLAGIADETSALIKEGLEFALIPGVSTSAAVPMSTGVALGSSGTVHHVDLGVTRGTPEYTRYLDSDSSIVLKGNEGQLAAAAKNLIAAGWPKSTALLVVADGTTIDQRTFDVTLASLHSRLNAAGRRSSLPARLIAIISPAVVSRHQLATFEQRELFGWRVLLPQTKQCGDSLRRRLEHYGARSQLVSTLSVEPPRTPQLVDKAIKNIADGCYEWIGFTSAIAVRALREKFDDFGLDVRALGGVKIASAGVRTSEALRAWGIRPDLEPDDDESLHGLLAAWPEFDDRIDPINGVFLPRADISTDTLVAGLTERGWQVDDVTAYRTVRAAPPAAPIREAIKGGSFDAVLFTSSATVRNLVGIAGKPHTTTVVACIGAATAKTAQEYGLRVDVVAASATQEALVDALAQYGREQQLLVNAGAVVSARPSQRRGAERRRRLMESATSASLAL